MDSSEPRPESGRCALTGVVPFTMMIPMLWGSISGCLVAGTGGSEFDRRLDRPCGIFTTECSGEISVDVIALSEQTWSAVLVQDIGMGGI